MLGIRISYRSILPVKFGLNNKRSGGTMDKNHNDFNSVLNWLAIPLTSFFYLIAIAMLVVACLNGCGGGDDDNCAVHCTPGPDAGPTVDSDQTAPDATPDTTTPDGNTDACANYEWLNGTVWNCSGVGGDNCDMTAVYNESIGDCVIRCQGTGGFSVTPNYFQVSTDHQHITEPVECWYVPS